MDCVQKRSKTPSIIVESEKLVDDTRSDKVCVKVMLLKDVLSHDQSKILVLHLSNTLLLKCTSVVDFLQLGPIFGSEKVSFRVLGVSFVRYNT